MSHREQNVCISPEGRALVVSLPNHQPGRIALYKLALAAEAEFGCRFVARRQSICSSCRSDRDEGFSTCQQQIPTSEDAGYNKPAEHLALPKLFPNVHKDNRKDSRDDQLKNLPGQADAKDFAVPPL